MEEMVHAVTEFCLMIFLKNVKLEQEEIDELRKDIEEIEYYTTIADECDNI